MLSLKNLFHKLVGLFIPDDERIAKLVALDASQLRSILPRAENFRERDDDTFSIFNYRNNNVRSLVWAMKYKANSDVLQLAAEIMYEEIMELAQEKLILEGKSKIALVPIPASKRTYRERGYNQCELVAQAIRKISKNQIEVWNILEKVRETGHQTALKRSDRLKNMRNSMQLKGDKKEILKDENYLLIIVDDVCTTGATIKEARSALGEAGFTNVLALTFAH